MEKAVFTYQPKPKTSRQPTQFQSDGAETAELFKEPGKTSLYARIFKVYPLDRAKLIECREWALKNGKNPAALFMKTYKQFTN